MLAICPPFFLQKQRFLPRAAAEGKSQTIFIPVGGKNMQKLRKFLNRDEDEVLNRYLVRIKTNMTFLNSTIPQDSVSTFKN